MPSFSIQFIPNSSSVLWPGADGPDYAIGANPSRYRSVIYQGMDLGQALSNTQSFEEFAGGVPGAVETPTSTTLPPGTVDPALPPGLPVAPVSGSGITTGTAVTEIYARDHMNRKISFVRRDTYPVSGVVWNVRAGAPQDLSGGRLLFTAKWDYKDTSAVITRSSDPSDGILFTSPTTGEWEMTILPAQTAGLPNVTLRLVYDLQFTDAAGAVSTVMRGPLVILPDVST